jgi:hypothetical protein
MKKQKKSDPIAIAMGKNLDPIIYINTQLQGTSGKVPRHFTCPGSAVYFFLGAASYLLIAQLATSSALYWNEFGSTVLTR